MNKNIMGIDVGGTKIHAALYGANDLKLIEEKQIRTKAKEGLLAVLNDVMDLIEELRNEETLSVGLGIPGYVNFHTGLVLATPNIAFTDPVNVYAEFASKLDLPFAIDNDASLFTLAEFAMNWNGKAKNMLGLTLGTGLGGGIIINGEPYRGRDGFAGEFGHIAFDENMELEDLVSGKGDDATRGKFLGITISNLVHTFNPEVIALGGSVSKLFDQMKDDMWEEIRNRTVSQSNENLEIYVSRIKNAGTLGAAILAFKKSRHA